jgi:hypothetical protein
VKPVILNEADPKYVLKGIVNGQCAGGLLGQADWDLASLTKEANPYCTLTPVGNQVRWTDGSFAYKLDLNSNYTSLVEDTVSNIMIGMELDGTIADIYQASINQLSDIDCSGGVVGDVTTQLSFTCKYARTRLAHVSNHKVITASHLIETINSISLPFSRYHQLLEEYSCAMRARLR